MDPKLENWLDCLVLTFFLVIGSGAFTYFTSSLLLVSSKDTLLDLSIES